MISMMIYIQAGGQSRRMKQDKAWLDVAGRPLIEHVLAAARAATDDLNLVVRPAMARQDRYLQLARQWNAGLIPDLHEGRGPLGGIATALRHCSAGKAAMMLACDLPCLTPELLNWLWWKHDSTSFLITIPLDGNGRRQPLTAIYEPACLPVIESMIEAGDLRLENLLDRVRTNDIPFAELAHLPGAERFFFNLNSPEDLARLS